MENLRPGTICRTRFTSVVSRHLPPELERERHQRRRRRAHRIPLAPGAPLPEPQRVRLVVLHLDQLPVEDPALHARPADAERAGLAEHLRFDRRPRRLGGQGSEQVSRTALLHGRRHHPGVERASGQHRVQRRRDQLRREIVEVGLEHPGGLAVRGGGHSVAGHGLIDGGLVVDLRRIRHVSVDPLRRRASAGGGATWEDFDPATQAHGLAVTGGTFVDTGIGGLSLGVVESLVGNYPEDWPLSDWIGIETKTAVAFLIILVVLLVRPAGLFGSVKVERV